MQGHRSSISPLPDSINFDSGSSSSGVAVDQQICWGNLRDQAESRLIDCTISGVGADTFMGSVAQEGQNLNRWLVGEPSSSSAPDADNHDERNMQNGWPSSANAAPRLEAQCYQPTSSVSRSNINLNLDGNHHHVSGQSFMQFHSTGSSSHNYDLNMGPIGRVGGDHMECFNSSDYGDVENKLMMSGSNPSDPFASAISNGFLMEEGESRPARSLDNRRLSCKRKAVEVNVGQSSTGGSSFSRENNLWPDVSPFYDEGSSMNASTPVRSAHGSCPPDFLNPRLGLGMGGLIPENHAPNVAGGAETSQQNHRMRLRMNSSSQQDSVLRSSYTPMENGYSSAPPVHQQLRHLPVNPQLDLTAPMPPNSTAASGQSSPLRMSQRHIQALRWNASPSSLPASSSAAAGQPEADALLIDDLGSRSASRNISEPPIFNPALEGRSSSHYPRNWPLGGSNASLTRHAASSSRSSQGSDSHILAGPNWVPRRSQSPYSRRLSEYVRRTLLPAVGAEAVAQGHNILAQRAASSSSQELPPSGSGSQGHNLAYPRSALRLERQGDGAGAAPYSLRALAAGGEGRSRLVSEIRNVLDLMRRGEALRLEDVMILDQTVLFGVADIHDQHRDMRLDVDNMSYEELLALEERIGNVCTGLSEETILSLMKQRTYLALMKEEQMEIEPCCICRENYNEGEELGTLDCGHDFHTGCIKQWLAQKNLCPICKTTGLSI
ncbi:putative E3 ubiquitin-protein ligase RHG1A [Drosera capensis]